MKEKPITWLGSSLDDYLKFPITVIKAAGYQLGKVQNGQDPENWKRIGTVGPGAIEIRINEADGWFRVIYVAKFKEAVYVLHSFQKKTNQTSKNDIALAKKRYKEIGG